jgi:hypothetical protein
MHVLAAASTGLALLGARFNKTVIFFSFFLKKSLCFFGWYWGPKLLL